MAKIIDSTNLGYLISKIKSSFWPKSDVVQIGLDNSPTSGSDNLVKSGGVYSALGNKQDTLVSGTNIKTINNESILGSGNLTISAGSSVTESTVAGWGFTKNTGTLTGVQFNGSNATVTNGVASISATIPTTLDQIADGTSRKLSNYLPLSGGSLNNNSTLSIREETLDNRACIDGNGFYAFSNGNGTILYGGDRIRKGSGFLDDFTGNYSYMFPSSSGTLALTSDIPSAVTESTVLGWGFTKNEGTLTSHATHKLTASNGTATAVNQGTEITYVESLTGTNTATSGDLSVSATRKKVTIPTAVTESTVSGWGFTKNAGTLTGVKVNGSNATVTSGVADIGTVITSETQLSKGTTSGSGNAVTDISVSNHQITLTKGSTFLTSVKTINNQTITGTGNLTLDTLPTVSASDNGKILMVVNGAWALVSPVTIYSGSGEPNNSMGNNGDIYLQT